MLFFLFFRSCISTLSFITVGRAMHRAEQKQARGHVRDVTRGGVPSFPFQPISCSLTSEKHVRMRTWSRERGGIQTSDGGMSLQCRATALWVETWKKSALRNHVWAWFVLHTCPRAAPKTPKYLRNPHSAFCMYVCVSCRRVSPFKVRSILHRGIRSATTWSISHT